jgi:hypothetical protein
MDQTFDATEIKVGYHPDGYRIDKTASPMNRYTKWQIMGGNHWCNPKAVSFHALPQQGWFEIDKFNWDDSPVNEK